MKLSILHLSDLHRDPDNPIRNDVLLDSLENDRRRYSSEENPAVRRPDLVIVSGDIIQGVEPDALEPEIKLKGQYQEALEFLSSLSDRFVNGDRKRVILVPGNHDVSAHQFEKSLRRVEILEDRKKELVKQLFSVGSSYRWSWSKFELYEIADHPLYVQRMAAFAEFYSAFYNGARTFDLDPEKQINVYDFPDLTLSIVGFSSCFNNDLLNRQGSINPACIALSGEKLRESPMRDRLSIAVWHHNTEGAPNESDYLDANVVQYFIDQGFSLGFHGHQHRPQFLDTRFRHGIDRRIVILSAGTLCGGASVRFARSYNIVELDTEARCGRLHVREMQNDNLRLPIWGRRALPGSANSYYDFLFDASPPPEPRTAQDTTAMLTAEAFYDATEYRKAADILISVLPSDTLARPLLLECLVRLQATDEIARRFDPPRSEAEVIHLLDALWAEGRHQRLREVLRFPIVAGSTDPSIVEIKQKFEARLRT